MRIVTANLKNGLTTTERIEDATKVYAQLGTPEPIVFWQEIRTAANHDEVRGCEPTGTQHLFGDLPIPISVPARYAVSEMHSLPCKPLTGPAEGGYDVGSAPRWYAVVKLEDQVRTDLRPFYVVNTHLTNGCEWDKAADDPTLSDCAKFLRPYWTDHWDLLKAKVDVLKGADFTVFYGGDFNRRNSPELGSAEKLAVGAGAIDKLAVIDRSVDSALVSTGGFGLHSDHDAYWAKWDLSNRPAA